eukprot:772453-Pleurochrysis_carterae.AAC.1
MRGKRGHRLVSSWRICVRMCVEHVGKLKRGGRRRVTERREDAAHSGAEAHCKNEMQRVAVMPQECACTRYKRHGAQMCRSTTGRVPYAMRCGCAW